MITSSSDADMLLGGQDNHSYEYDFLLPTQQEKRCINANMDENIKGEIKYWWTQLSTQRQNVKNKNEKTRGTIRLINTYLELTINLLGTDDYMILSFPPPFSPPSPLSLNLLSEQLTNG